MYIVGGECEFCGDKCSRDEHKKLDEKLMTTMYVFNTEITLCEECSNNIKDNKMKQYKKWAKDSSNI